MSWRPSLIPVLGLTAVLLAPPTVVAAPLLEAIAEAPTLQAARQRLLAAQARQEGSGRLPDPQLEVMGMRRRPAMAEDMTMWELTLRQPLPRWGERAADRRGARAAIGVAQTDYAAMAGDLAADVAMALADIAAAEARSTLLDGQRVRLESVLRSIESRLATGGTARLADRLTVQTRLANLELAVAEAQRLAADAAARIRGQLGLAPGAPLPEFAAPEPAAIVPAEAVPVQQAEAADAVAEAMVAMAQTSARPMTAVGLRLEREEASMGNTDTVGLAFMTEIPFRSRRYALTDVRAARAEQAAAQAEATAAQYRITSAVSQVERAEQLAALARRVAEATRTRLQAETDALLRGAAAGSGGGESTVLQVVELLDQATETELQIVAAEAAARTARAELWRYLPARELLPDDFPSAADADQTSTTLNPSSS